jgi:hypothetical protein
MTTRTTITWSSRSGVRLNQRASTGRLFGWLSIPLTRRRPVRRGVGYRLGGR